MTAYPRVLLLLFPSGSYHEQTGPLLDLQEATTLEAQELPAQHLQTLLSSLHLAGSTRGSPTPPGAQVTADALDELVPGDVLAFDDFDGPVAD
jgi:hypothetical protein